MGTNDGINAYSAAYNNAKAKLQKSGNKNPKAQQIVNKLKTKMKNDNNSGVVHNNNNNAPQTKYMPPVFDFNGPQTKYMPPVKPTAKP